MTMNWERMTIGEYAQFQRANGERLVQRDGVWWRRSRPFFYQPLFPFLAMTPHSTRPPLAAVIGGYQHVVPSRPMANSCMSFFIFDEPQAYSLQQLKHSHRANIKKGLRHFTVKEVSSLQEFIDQGYPVYLSFYSRTKYSFKRERRDKTCFAEWARILYAFPKILVLGAYHESELAAVDISYRVEDVVMLATFFSSTDALRLRVSDVVIHALRERAALCPDVKCLFLGTITGRKGIDESKLGQGCKIASMPAFYSVNPISLLVIKIFMGRSYRKLVAAEHVGNTTPSSRF